MDRTSMPEISVVIPVYKCSECLRHLHQRLDAALGQVPGTAEIVFVDDRSPDDSWQVLTELAAVDSRLRLVRLSRNFGQHAAITAGVGEARGRWVVVMDCDLQDPPEEVPRLYAKAKEGYDVVFARRKVRRQRWPRRASNRIYFWLRSRLSGVDLETEHANLSIMSRTAADAFLQLKDKHRNFLLILYWLGFEHTSIEFEHAERYAGRSSYNLRGLLRVAADGVFFHTTVLLRWIVYSGFAIAASSVALAVYFLYSYFTNNAYPGWTSVIVVLLMIGGFIIMSTGVTGLYIGKVFEQVKDRPLFVIDQRVDGVAASQELEAERLEQAAEAKW